MNKFSLPLLIALLIPAAASASLPNNFFAKRSVLAEGNWVKVGVDQTGIYEISYETLRNMGFSNPAAVSVYGRGGELLDPSFVKASGSITATDDLSALDVLHYGNKLYFFGQGPDKITFQNNPSMDIGGYFNRKSKNIYTDYGYYFLTDSRPVSEIPKESFENIDSLPEVTEVIRFIHHEKDLKQNTTASGQLFWGEQISSFPEKKAFWDVDLSDAIDGSYGYIRYDVYLPNKTANNFYVNFEDEAPMSVKPSDIPSSYFNAIQPNNCNIFIPAKKTRLYMSYDYENPDFDNVDFWTLSYQAQIPDLNNLPIENAAQCRFVLPSMERGNKVKLNFNNGASYMLWDITSPTAPKAIELKSQVGNASAEVYSNSNFSDLIVFDPTRPQLQICGYSQASKAVENQNIHGIAQEGADLLIICTPKMRNAAERVAEIHRQKEGLSVVVVTTEECYNEFSQGVPDATAYRLMAKMFYSGITKLKNILFVGPMTSDVRGIEFKHDPLDYIIAYQYASCSISAGSFHNNDFYGIMEDFINEKTLEKTPVDVGVGILPIRYEGEIENFCRKLENYIDRDDFAYHLNRYVSIGGDGNYHTHDNHMLIINNSIWWADNKSTLLTQIAIEAYGYRNANKKLITALDKGATFMQYFGHGSENMITGKPYFFNTAHVYNLKNDFPPVTCFAGCSLSNPDRDRNGLGEVIVTRAPHGAIASVMASRETWAAQNLEFFKSFYNCTYRLFDSTKAPRRTETPTLGEIFALTKSESTIPNEMAYLLIGDPAIKVPVAHYKVMLEDVDVPNMVAGEKFSVKGFIADENDDLNSSFNGEVVIRLMEPAVMLQCQNLVTNQTKDSPLIEYEENQSAMGVAEVKDGKFEISFHIPSSTVKFDGQGASLKIAAYDKTQRLGAGSTINAIYVKNPNETSSEDTDKTAPSIDLIEFDNESCSLDIKVSDNYALNLSDSPMSSGFILIIDGKENIQALNSQAYLENDNLSYSRNVTLDGLTYGNHTALVKVKDAAGNEAEREISFTFEAPRPQYILSVKEISDSDVTLKIEGNCPEKSTLYIMDAQGGIVFSVEFTGNTYSWNRRSLSGRAVKAGHYKAYIIESGIGSNKGHSEIIDIPLI